MKHYNIPYHAHELTFTCYHRYDYLKDPVLCELFIRALGIAKEKFSFMIWAYVLMPNHVHLLIYTENEIYSIASILRYIKSKTSSGYRRYVLNQMPDYFDRYCVISKGKSVFRIWQAAQGFSPGGTD
ncbi:transposase [bacterium]|nr:transposase [bacterium]